MSRSRTSVGQFALAGLLARDQVAAQLHNRHVQVLAHVCAASQPLTPNDIAATTHVSPSQLSRLLAKLEEHALIQRSQTKPSFVKATEAGKAMIRRVDAYIASCRADAKQTAA